MKKINYLKGICVLLLTVAALSCKNDDDKTDQSLDLIGTWQRSDVSKQFEYRLSFQADNSGVRSVSEVNDEGQGISSSRTFNWMVNESTLTMDYGEEPEVTLFNFNADGYLFLTDLTALHFVKVED